MDKNSDSEKKSPSTNTYIRKIEIRLNMLDEKNSNAAVTLETKVNIRNM